MKLTVLGGAGEHGRACFLIEANAFKILLDCGVKEGDEVQRYPAITAAIAKRLDAVFISHLHPDHYGGLPWLIWLLIPNYTGVCKPIASPATY